MSGDGKEEMKDVLWSARNTVEQVKRETYHTETEVSSAPQEPLLRPEGSCALSVLQEVTSLGERERVIWAYGLRGYS